MGKGVVSDSHSLCMAASRSFALMNADLILLVGARLNWMLHFGIPPRFNKNVHFIQLDHSAETFHNSKSIQVPLLGDLTINLKALSQQLQSFKFQNDQWITDLRKASQENQDKVNSLLQDRSEPRMNYYQAFELMKPFINHPDTLLIAEGANTMDISRSCFFHDTPRRLLDAATYGTVTFEFNIKW